MSTVLPGGMAPGTPGRRPTTDEDRLIYQTSRLVAYRDDGPIARIARQADQGPAPAAAAADRGRPSSRASCWSPA